MMLYNKEQINSVVIKTTEMQAIENLIFEGGMPVASLMEKAAILTANRIKSLYSLSEIKKVGVLVGSGHNGGDALVIARELYLNDYNVLIYCPFSQLKELTANHAKYATNLGIEFCSEIELLKNCDLIIDGLFGFGLKRAISGQLLQNIKKLNQWNKKVVSIDLPSGIHTDTGEVLGIAVRSSYTFCLGLWKQAFFQDSALEYLGKVERIDFGIPPQYVWQVLGQPAPINILTTNIAKKCLPIPRRLNTHKYQQGHLLLICGSSAYAGSAILAGLGARSSGVGMLSIAAPKSIKSLLVSKIPEALIIECPETENGAILNLPILNFNKYDAIACGCGLTTDKNLNTIINQVLNTDLPLILDADGLNLVAEMNNLEVLSSRQAKTILTPHLGEFKRLFPSFSESDLQNRLEITQKAAQLSNAIVLLKGARTIIASPEGKTWLIPESTPALAKGGSGDVLTGLIGGLVAQEKTIPNPLEDIVATSAWLHQQAGILATKNRSELGVDGVTLSEYILKVIL